MNRVSLPSAATDARGAPNTYLPATLYCDGACSAVRIRNITPTTALLEGGPVPSPGTLVQLVRGELIVHALVARSGESQFQLKFSGSVDVQQWLAAPGNSHQQWVDEVVRLVKAGAVPLPVPGLGVPDESGNSVRAADLASDLGRASELIGNLGDILAGDIEILMRHGDALQNLDIAKQVIVAVQMSLAAHSTGPDEAARLAGLRRSAEQALLKGA